MDSRCLIALIAVIVLVAPAVGISQGEAVYLGQHVDISNVIGWSSEIAWNGGYAPPSAGSSPVVIKLPGSLNGKADYYIDPAVFGKYPGRWYKWDGGGFTAPKENTVVFNIGGLPDEPPVSEPTAVPTVTVGPTPRVEAPIETTTESQDPIFAQIGILIGICLVAIFVLYAVITRITPPPKPIDPVIPPCVEQKEAEVKPDWVYYTPPKEHPTPPPLPKCEHDGCYRSGNLHYNGKELCYEHMMEERVKIREAAERMQQAEEEAKRSKENPDNNGIYTTKPKREYISVETKRFVYNRAKNRCEECGYSNTQVLEIHHVIPVRDGGTNHPHNLKLLCPTCHRVMGNEYKELS